MSEEFGPNSVPPSRRPAIVGLGMTQIGKVYGRSPAQFAAEAVRLAADDAGIPVSDIDGLITSSGVVDGVHIDLQVDLGIKNLRFLTEMQAYGSTATAMIQVASMAVQSGMAQTVAVVWADSALRDGVGGQEAYGGLSRAVASGWYGLSSAAGLGSANQYYALAARRHMLTYGTTNEQLGAIAIAQRQWAAMNPLAQVRAPMDMNDYLASRWVADPFRLFDCCMVSNGGIAVIVTSAGRAKDLQQPIVNVIGWAQSHPGSRGIRDDNFGLVSSASKSGPAALGMAGIELADIDVAEFYDCYTFTVLLTLEGYGFCKPGEGGAFAASGALGPQGKLKLNTGGGQLSAYYMWGMTPLSEAIIQARGQAGERQVDKHELVLVSGNGGILDHHGTLVLQA